MFGTEKWNYWMDTHWIKFQGDSIINDTLFKVIYRSDDEFQDRWYRYGAIREDSLKRVYVHREGKQNLLYNFNLDVGDSIKNNNWGSYVYVTGTDSVKIGPDSVLRKRIFLDSWHESDKYYSYWIEEIGSIQGILSGAEHIGILGAAYSLICFSRNDTLIYNSFPEQANSPCFPQGYPNGISEFSHQENFVNVFYGDYEIIFSFKNPRPDTEIFIYDELGRMYTRVELNMVEMYELPKEHMISGIYFYLFKSGQEYHSGKFIIP
jgi:hypothetical protein